MRNNSSFPAFNLMVGAILLLLALAVPIEGLSQGQPTMLRPDLSQSRYAGEVNVPLNKSRILQADQKFTELHVANPEIADVLALTDRTLYVLGKQPGATSLVVYGQNKSLLAIVDLTVSYDIEGLKRRLFELMQGEPIEVRAANGSLVLSGTVSSTEQLTRIVAVSERFAPNNVTNLLKVEGSQQVMLAVRFAEMKRTAVKELGLNAATGIVRAGDLSFQLLTGLGGSLSAFGSLGVSVGRDLDVLLDALEQKRVLKTLAEPNLIALSGQSASFLAGGEFPVPVAQDSGPNNTTTITVEFKEFGVRLSFTPTVLGTDLINLAVEPEVSAIDPTSSVTLSGFDIPGLTTRRAKTTVDLRDGQSFAIAGLLQSDFEDNIQQFPLLGDIPILGALFRSSDYQRDETELVIIVTPYLVKPARPGDLVLPTDSFVPPSEVDLFLHGKTETQEPGASQENRLPSGGRPQQGGLDGKVGHVLR